MQRHQVFTIQYGDGHVEQTAAEDLGPALRDTGIIHVVAWAIRVVTEGGQPIDASDIRVEGLPITSPTKIYGERIIWHEESESDSDQTPHPLHHRAQSNTDTIPSGVKHKALTPVSDYVYEGS